MQRFRVRRPVFCVLATLVAGAVLVFPASSALAAGPSVDRPLAESVAATLNAVRADAGLKPLAVSRQLSRAARAHAFSMARLGFFGHSSADGASAARRITSFYSVGGARSWAVGEVLMWSPGSPAAEHVVDLWLDSPPHRAQIVKRQWRDMGIAAVVMEDAPGAYGNRDVTIVVVDFGVRR